MNRGALRELFDFTTFTWASYRRSAPALAAELFRGDIAGSNWASLRDALFHLASGWDEWIIEQSSEPLAIVGADSVTNWDELDAVRASMRTRLRRIIDDTPDDVFDTPTDVGGGLRRSPREVVAHILLHERGHHGDITTLLTALGVTPHIVDYLVFVFAREQGTLSS